MSAQLRPEDQKLDKWDWLTLLTVLLAFVIVVTFPAGPVLDGWLMGIGGQ